MLDIPALCYRADEEVSDPKALLEDRSKAKCVSQWYDYQVICCFISCSLILQFTWLLSVHTQI